jgi:hypothetical protein
MADVMEPALTTSRSSGFFEDRCEAVRRASEFLRQQPDQFSPVLRAIEVRPRRA